MFNVRCIWSIINNYPVLRVLHLYPSPRRHLFMEWREECVLSMLLLYWHQPITTPELQPLELSLHYKWYMVLAPDFTKKKKLNKKIIRKSRRKSRIIFNYFQFVLKISVTSIAFPTNSFIKHSMQYSYHKSNL